MSGKRKNSESVKCVGKKRRTITMENKVDIIRRFERGEKMADIAREYEMNRSTIATILKDKTRISEHIKSCTPMQSTIITKRRGTIMEEMENLLTIWMESQQQRRMPISLNLIQEKATSLYEDLRVKKGESSTDAPFTASHGWFQRFKKRNNYHNVKITGEAASADVTAAVEFPKILENIIKTEEYLPQQIFNVDETGLFWKKMPDRSYISKEEKSMPGFKSAKDRLTLMIGGNCSGDYKIKPLLIYRAENPRALKNIPKDSLPVVWKSNRKAWVTLAVFEEWFLKHFIPDVKKYCKEINIPFKILLLLDNAPGHPQQLNDFHPNVKVIYLPPNTTSLLQPMDQGVIASLKKYYLRRTFKQAIKATDDKNCTLKEFWGKYNIYEAVKNLGGAWSEVKTSNMKGVWKKLCPHFFTNESLDNNNVEENEEEVINNILDLGNQLNLEVEAEDIHQLLESHSQELTNEELLELTAQPEEPIDDETEEEEPKTFTVKQLTEGFTLIEKALTCFQKQDTNENRFAKVSATVHDALTCYKLILDEKKRTATQTSITQFFNKNSKEACIVGDPMPSTSKE